jgi:hypothetical protein
VDALERTVPVCLNGAAESFSAPEGRVQPNRWQLGRRDVNVLNHR